MMSRFIGHAACPSCSSGDALSIYDNEDDTKSAHCFSCNHNIRNYGNEDVKPRFKKMTKTFLTLQEVSALPYADKKDRKINDETVKKFEIKATTNTTTGQQDAHFYPYYIKGALSGYKSRVLPKDFTAIGAVGNIKGCDLFGQNLCTPGGFRLVITEGEEDCLAVYRMLDAYNKHKGTDFKPNVVSLCNGASGASGEIDKAMQFVSSFKEVLICFDQDKAGKQALSNVAGLLELEKFKVIEFSEKDASDMLMKGKQQEFISSYFNAKKWCPGSIVNMSDTEELLLEQDKEEITPYPKQWSLMNSMLYGLKTGDLDVWTSGTGSGKSQIFKEMIYHDLKASNNKIGCIALEESLKTTNSLLVGLELNKRIHLPDVRATVSDESIREAFKGLDTKRIEFYDQKKEMNDLDLLAQVRYMAAGLGCKHIYLDHISLIIAGSARKGDERQRIDELMTRLKIMAKELNIWIGIIVHLSKPAKGQLPFELGFIPNVDDLRGSGTLKTSADNIICIQRNGNHAIEFMRDVFRLHVIKNRLSGTRGSADFFKFDKITGRINVISPPEYDIIEKKNKKKDSYNDNDGEF